MRVIAGTFRSRKLDAPPGMETRPTLDRVKEALYSALGSVDGARVADLFAGSGSLGIEALSRGAAHAVFVESARPALDALRSNLARLLLGADVATVLPVAVERAGKALGERGPYDLILCDPPWPTLDQHLKALEKAGAVEALAQGGRLIVEHPTGVEVAITGTTVTWTRHWGDTAISWFERVDG